MDRSDVINSLRAAPPPVAQGDGKTRKAQYILADAQRELEDRLAVLEVLCEERDSIRRALKAMEHAVGRAFGARETKPSTIKGGKPRDPNAKTARDTLRERIVDLLGHSLDPLTAETIADSLTIKSVDWLVNVLKNQIGRGELVELKTETGLVAYGLAPKIATEPPA